MSADGQYSGFAGTPLFAAPEVVLSEQAGPPWEAAPADIWSAAFTFMFLLCGRLPSGLTDDLLRDEENLIPNLAEYYLDQVAFVELLT